MIHEHGLHLGGSVRGRRVVEGAVPGGAGITKVTLSTFEAPTVRKGK